MQNPLADTLIGKCVTIATIGKELNEAGSHTEADRNRIERLYFEIGSLVLANIGTIAAALYGASALRHMVVTPIPTQEDLDAQAKALNDLDLNKH